MGSDGGGAVKAAAESLGQNAGPATVQGMTGTTVSGGAVSTEVLDPTLAPHSQFPLNLSLYISFNKFREFGSSVDAQRRQP